MKKIFFASAFFIFLVSFKSYSQTETSVLTNAISKLKTLSTNHIIENAYLHFDKPYYAAGDTMYYKAYVTLGEHHELSKLSGMLHVDLISPDNKITRSEKLQVVNGVAWGDFALPRTLSKGNYTVRAYTQYMQNGGTETFFNKKIAIGSIKETPSAEEAAQINKADIQFFPEGGNLITGVESKVAFKAIGPNGLGANVKGVIVDNTNAEVTKFEASHLGMGTFYLAPRADKTYKAKVTYADGSQATVDLPKPEAKGIMLAVNDSADKFTVEIVTNKAYFRENLNKELNIVIYAGGTVNSVKTRLDNLILGLDVKKDQFPAGVAQVTLFSQTGEPLCERLVFLQNNDLNLAIKSDKATYPKDEKVHIDLNAKARLGDLTNGHFSVSVTDETMVPADENNERTILTDLLLTSQLKGYIEQPNYYFINPSSITRDNLDALMLTQGYRRFNWDKLLTNAYPAFTIQAENSFTLTGTAKLPTGQPLAKKSVILRSTSDEALGNNILSAETDEQGNFKFSNLAFKDTAHFVIQSEMSKGKTAQVTVDGDKPGPAVSAINWPGLPTDVNANMPAYLDNEKQKQAWYNNTIALRRIDVNGYKKAPYRSSNISGAGNADQVIKGDDIMEYSTLSEALNGKLHGGYVQGGVPYLESARTVVGGSIVNDRMLVIVDGVSSPVSSMGVNLEDFSPAGIETIEVLKGQNASVYGIQGAGGVLVITTKQTMLAPVLHTTGIGTLQFSRVGFYKAREFYSPKYENITSSADQPDLRSTIFWKPELVTDKDGNASVDFYNADTPGNYRVVVEGMDDKGNIGRQVYRYKVE